MTSPHSPGAAVVPLGIGEGNYGAGPEVEERLVVGKLALMPFQIVAA